MQDVRQAARLLRRQPGFAAAAILTIALGIGATTAIFSVVNGVLIKPLPYPDSEALVRIVHTIDGTVQTYFSDAIFVTYADNNQAFESIGVWTPFDLAATITGNGEPEEVRALTVSRGILTTLGVQPEMGRWFSPADDAPGAPDTVMLTHGYWHRKFAGDSAVLDRSLTINGRPHRIVGVMPAEFRFGGERDVILPLRIDRARLVRLFRLNGIARMKRGVTLAGANADVARLLELWFVNFRVNVERKIQWTPTLRPLKADVVGDIGTTLWVLLGAIGIVLLMACANVANLLLVRADARRHEFAIRAALGAQWTRVARALLAESLTLALLGGALGVGLAYAGLRALVASGPSNLPRLSEISMDLGVLGFAVIISLLSGLLFGLMPILKYARPRLAASIGARGASQSRERQRSQNALVAVQLAFALVLLVSSGLMIRSFDALRRVEAGFANPQHLQTFSISIPPASVADPERVTRMQHDILDRIAAVPGVASAAFTTRLPMDTRGRSSAAMIPADRPAGDRRPPNRQIKYHSPGMFDTQGTALAAGRDFTWIDIHHARDVAIISENLAREWWGSASDAVGRRIHDFDGGPSGEIVGVAKDVHDDGVHQRAPATVYWPARLHARSFGGAPYQPRRVSIAVRTDRAGTESLLNELRDAVWSVDANLPLAQERTLGELYDASMARTSFTLVMLAIAGAMALLLGICGIYGVLAYAVSQRRREIGIRLALGAQAHQIRRLFVRRGLILIGTGVAIGLAGAAGFTRLMQAMVFGISPLDPVTFATMPIVLAAAALAGSYLPARRAVAVDPVETLRADWCN
jgi:predicted permease